MGGRRTLWLIGAASLALGACESNPIGDAVSGVLGRNDAEAARRGARWRREDRNVGRQVGSPERAPRTLAGGASAS